MSWRTARTPRLGWQTPTLSASKAVQPGTRRRDLAETTSGSDDPISAAKGRISHIAGSREGSALSPLSVAGAPLGRAPGSRLILPLWQARLASSDRGRVSHAVQ